MPALKRNGKLHPNNEKLLSLLRTPFSVPLFRLVGMGFFLIQVPIRLGGAPFFGAGNYHT
jgi:hypothetical protein